MSAPTREDVLRMAREAATKVVDHDFSGNPITDADAMLLGAFGPLVHRLAELAFAAGTAAKTRRDHIDALVGDRLTADKADHICERDGYTVTGVVLSLPDGRACIVNRSAVRWLSGPRDLLNLLFTDSADNVRLVAEAVAAEREACAKVCDELAELNRERSTDSMWQWGECAAAIRARGQA